MAPESNSNNTNNIKDAFQKIKHDIYSLYSEISSLKRSITEIHYEMAKVSQILSQLSEITHDISKKQEAKETKDEKDEKSERSEKKPEKPTPAEEFSHEESPASQQIKPATPAYNQTVPTHLPVYFPYSNKENKEKQPFSTGNEGVPTDRQTNQQSDNTSPTMPIEPIFTPKPIKLQSKYPANPIDDAVRALDSLDSLKKEIRLKFKQLTDQEILIFSTLYQMEEEQGPVDYKTLAVKLKLTESSIRDYIGRLLQKGIPVEKQRINNKKILLSVSQSLKRVASLQTILQLRDI